MDYISIGCSLYTPIIRALFAFDPERQAVVFCAGNKAGKNQKSFYRDMIKVADEQFRNHLNNLEK
ncbi:type II toxin-antitoxin system RelE/ParE family toxin [Xenorhabdus sp. Vera]|uniref:type II toxin-antitoxin system RelE/ParE family toxin n=1 Tax=Xenorhabdus koppenhoeferi TaxID=351659 RepID=UPI0019CC1678|nr:type II toxin-antitoxin system RelE/ParE family toxin [Xenorhabdus sp. Vera]